MMLCLTQRSKFFYATSITLVLLACGIWAFFNLPSIRHLPLAGGLLLALYVLLLTNGSARLRWNYFLRSENTLPVIKNPQKTKRIALTFDDGPSERSAAVLDILKQHQVPATFFVIGQRVLERPELTRRMLTEGHALGNHSHTHGHLFNFKWAAAARLEIDVCNDAIKQATGTSATLFRAPHGVMTAHLAAAIQGAQMRSIGWDVRSFDTASKNPETLLARIMSQLQNRSIILLHDDCEITAEILPALIQQARTQGFEFAAIS